MAKVRVFYGHDGVVPPLGSKVEGKARAPKNSTKPEVVEPVVETPVEEVEVAEVEVVEEAAPAKRKTKAEAPKED